LEHEPIADGSERQTNQVAGLGNTSIKGGISGASSTPTPGNWEVIKFHLPATCFAALVVLFLAGQLALTFVFHASKAEQRDYIAYAFPALAAVAAGLNIYVRNEQLWFWVSSGFVFFGFLAFLVRNDTLGEAIKQVIYIVGFVAVVVALICYSLRSKTQENPVVESLIGGIALVLVVIQGTLVLEIDRGGGSGVRAATDAVSTEMLCKPIAGYPPGQVALMCTNKGQ
jgi:hypothetical protein